MHQVSRAERGEPSTAIWRGRPENDEEEENDLAQNLDQRYTEQVKRHADRLSTDAIF